MRPTLLAAASFALAVNLGSLVAQGPAEATLPPEPATVALPPELDRVLRDYERLWQAGDTAALAGLFAEDGWVFASGRPPAQGRTAIRATYEDLDGGPLRLRALAYGTDGTNGYILGAYGYGDTQGDMGKFTLTLRSAPDGRWLIASDMDNSNRPHRCPEPSAAGVHEVHSVVGPAVVVGVSSGLRFVDRQRFVLFEVADAEQHVFVDAAPDGTVRRLVWVQFEAFLPGVDERYDYSASHRRVTLGGFPFFADSAPRTEAAPRPGSDGEHLARLLERHGLRLPRQRLWQRLVYLGDDARNEVMVIYLEDLAPHGFTAADLAEGPGAGRWPALADGLLERARALLSVKRRD